MPADPPPKKVVRRVVRTAAPPKNPPASQPTMRYGRPVVTTPSGPKITAREESTTDAPEGQESPVSTPPAARAKVSRPSRPTIKAPSVQIAPIITAVRERTSAVVGAVGSRSARYGRATGALTARGYRRARAWRIPHLDPIPATLVTGLVVGLMSVLLGFGALQMFTQLRGVAGGGGTWGSLTLVVVTFIAFALGERLLTAFGTPLPRVTSFLAIMLTMIALLSVFLRPADSPLGLVIVPALSVVSFLISHWLVTLTESAPPEVE